MTVRPDVLTRYKEKSKHPRWLGDSPCLPYPPGTMFGHLRLRSSELVRVSHTLQSGRRAGKTRTELYAQCTCTLCGTDVTVLKSNLLSGKTIQCKKCNVRAGHETLSRRLWGGKVPDETDRWIKDRWDGICRRCYDPTRKSYHRYGGRGIKLSAEFADPIAFVAYAKSLPGVSKDKQIDRIDNDKGYERGNLRWVSPRENARNQERSIYVVYNGVRMPLCEFVERHTKLSYTFALALHKRGIPAEEIANWRKNNEAITYNGAAMSFRHFVKHYTELSCTYARKLYLSGKSLDAIANWRKGCSSI